MGEYQMTYLIIGLLIGYILTDKKKAILNYLGTPTNGKLQLDWTTRQVFRIVSRKASERFYEASRYLGINWFIAVACGLGFINIYQFSYSTRIEDVYNTAIKIYPFWKKLDDENSYRFQTHSL